MDIDWKKADDQGFETACVDAFELSISPAEPMAGFVGTWIAAITVYGLNHLGRDGGSAEHESVELKNATSEDAKRAALDLAAKACASLVAAGVAAEREACARLLDEEVQKLEEELRAVRSKLNEYTDREWLREFREDNESRQRLVRRLSLAIRDRSKGVSST